MSDITVEDVLKHLSDDIKARALNTVGYSEADVFLRSRASYMVGVSTAISFMEEYVKDMLMTAIQVR